VLFLIVLLFEDGKVSSSSSSSSFGCRNFELSMSWFVNFKQEEE